MRKRLPLLIGAALAIVAGLSACSFGGNAQEAKQVNLDNQRKAAVSFLSTQGGVETIRFTREGGLSGFGASWTVNAVITIDSTEYQQILGVNKYSMSGKRLPTIPPESTAHPATVIYSDGSSEVIEWPPHTISS